MKKLLGCLFVVFLAMIMTAGTALAATVTGIELPAGIMVDEGSQYQMAATLLPEGAEAAIKWTSSRPQYATIDKETGMITAKKMGRTIITAKAGSVTATRLITVTKPKATSIKLNKKSATLSPGGTLQLTAKLTPQYTSEKPVFATSDETVATVSETGLVTAVADGIETSSCVITATLNSGKKAVVSITVRRIAETKVRMATSAVIPLYSTKSLTATVYPLNAYNRALKWSVVKNPDIASVDETGVVTGSKPGTAVIEARSTNGKYARCKVTVKAVRYTSFSITPSSSKTIEKGTTFTLKATIKPKNVSYPQVTYSSSDESVATVGADGVVTGVARGYAKITATGDNGKKNASVTVRVTSSDEVKVTISAIGDVMLGGDPRSGKPSYKAFEKLWNSKGAEYFFKKIKSELKGIAIANLEIPLYNTSKVVNGSRGYIFRGKTAYAQALAAGGIDVVNLDNNHIMDYGTAGYNSTKNAMKALGIGYCRRDAVAYVTQNGVKVGFVGYMPNSVSLSKMTSHIKSIRKKCDILVVSFHWGTEFVYRPSSTQTAYGRTAIKAGADLVLGHHSHVISGIEVYKGKHIVYGLGSIVSAVKRPDDIDTFIYRHTFSVSGSDVSNAGFEIVPVLMTEADEDEDNDAQPVIATGDDATRIKNKIKKYSPSSNPF